MRLMTTQELNTYFYHLALDSISPFNFALLRSHHPDDIKEAILEFDENIRDKYFLDATLLNE
jgi:hypothetical protein